jgi:hypothetical protein
VRGRSGCRFPAREEFRSCAAVPVRWKVPARSQKKSDFGSMRTSLSPCLNSESCGRVTLAVYSKTAREVALCGSGAKAQNSGLWTARHGWKLEELRTQSTAKVRPRGLKPAAISTGLRGPGRAALPRRSTHLQLFLQSLEAAFFPYPFGGAGNDYARPTTDGPLDSRRCWR